ncbi:WD40 repeat domain-containing protein [Wenyingzhuangia sp. IMCC45533]
MKQRIQFLNVLLFTSLMSFAQWTQVGSDIDGEAANGNSGFSVSSSADGTTIAVGAPFSNGNGTFSGHVRIYKYDANSWTQLGSDIDGEAANDYSGFSVSLSEDGTTVAIGAPLNSGNGFFSGHVRIYNFDGNNWTQLGSDIDGEAGDDESGTSVSLSADGTKVAIGAIRNDGNGLNSGHVRVYEYNGITSDWTQLGLDIDGEASGDESGTSVSLSADGTKVAIGALFNDGSDSNSGHVRVYRYDESNWTQLGSDIDGEAAADRSGSSVSLSADGTTVAVGASYNDENSSFSGYVRVYRYNESNWTQLGSDIDGEAANDNSGYSVSLSADGTRVAIGAPSNNGNGSFSGHVRIYNFNGSSWTQLGADIDGEAAGDESGTSVSLSADGTLAAIGARFNRGNGSSSGHVRVYKYTETTTLSSSHKKIEGLVYKVLNGRLVTNQSDVTISVTDVLGTQIDNQNLKGIYIATFTDSKGKTQINKLLIQ